MAKKKAAKRIVRSTDRRERSKYVLGKKKPKKSDTLWTPSMGLTNSALRVWQTCREQFARKYLDGWSSKRISVPLAYGTLWHLAQEAQGSRNPFSLIDEALASQKKTMTPYAYADLCFLADQIKVIFPIYAAYYKKQDADIRWVSRESSFSIPVSVLGETIPIRGKRDGVFTTSRGSFGLFETKSKSVIDGDQIASQLRADFQTLLYCWSLWKETDRVPGIVLYNVVKRPQLRQGKTETPTQLLQRLAATVEANKSQWFRRWSVTVTKQDLEIFENQHLIPLLQAFVTWWREVRQAPFLPERLDGRHAQHWLNLHALLTPFGKADLYDLMVFGSEQNVYQRPSAHPELDL